MKLNQRLDLLIADIKRISNGSTDLPIQIYDFIDTLNIQSIGAMQHHAASNTILLITSQQARKITVEELISGLKVFLLIQADYAVEIFLDGVHYTLGEVVFDRRNATYAITPGEKISWRSTGCDYRDIISFTPLKVG